MFFHCQNYQVFSLGLTLPSLVLVLAVETNINVFRKADLWQDINETSLLFFSTKKSPLLSYKCVSVQSSIWILSRAQLMNSGTADTLVSVHQPAAMQRESIQIELWILTHL